MCNQFNTIKRVVKENLKYSMPNFKMKNTHNLNDEFVANCPMTNLEQYN